jgi:hypothetical protein
MSVADTPYIWLGSGTARCSYAAEAVSDCVDLLPCLHVLALQGRQMKSPENPRVFILDFGLTRKREAMSLFQELEEAELHDFLLGRAWSDHAYGPW